MPPTLAYRLLVIDDTPAIHDDFRKVFQRVPTDAGGLDAAAAALFGTRPPYVPAPADLTEFTIDSAYQGREGADLVRAALEQGRPYAIAFVDMRMPPGWDGLETVHHLWKIDPRLQIVICTAHSDHSWHNIHTALGPTDSLIILKKPFDHIEARQLAHALGRKWTLARENEARVQELNALIQERTQELKVAEDRFARAFDANPHAQALMALDPFEFLNVNPAFTRQFGLSHADVKHLTPATFGRKTDPSRWLGLIDRLKAGGEIDEHEFVFERAPGDVRDLRCSARPVTIGHRACSIWLIRDVTEQVRLEQQFRQAQKMDAVGQLAAGIAHDFNNLLTVIQGYTSFALEDAAGMSPPSELVGVRDAANRAAALTRQLLVFSRRQITKPVPLNVAAAMSSLREMLARLLPERVRLEWLAADTLPRALADAANLEQVVMNLVINARDATTRHGVITVSFSSARLDEEQARRHPKARAGDFVVISVRDTGSGMTPEIMARIFEPFFTTKESGKGTGLGLSTVYGIVDQHNGWVDVRSEVGKGTTFDVYIPALEGSSVCSNAPFDTEISLSALKGRGEHVLIVEDDHDVRDVASRILTRAGYRVTEAEDGPSALMAWHYARHQFDLVMTDVEMPNGLSGVDLVFRMRRDKPDLKVILASGYSDQLLHGATAGLSDVPLLLKPYTQAGVVAKLRAALDAPAPTVASGVVIPMPVRAKE